MVSQYMYLRKVRVVDGFDFEFYDIRDKSVL